MSRTVKAPLALEHALLGLLRQRPMHAYEMHQTLTRARSLGLVWHIKQSQLYALLARLEAAGYLEAATEAQGTRPPRKVLHLTPRGQAAFERWMASPVEHGRDFRLEFLAKLFFAAQGDPAALTTLIERQREECKRWLGDLHQQATALADDRCYDWLVLQFRIGQIEAIVNWLDTCESTLLAGHPIQANR